jgi:uncharacterized protein (DUF1697 family)
MAVRVNAHQATDRVAVKCNDSNGCVEANRVAVVVFLRGVNVGGHRTFRPTKLALALKHLGATNIGAAGTLVIRRRVTQAQARAEVARVLPFVAETVVCQAREIVNLLSDDPFQGQLVQPDVVRFVSVLSQRPRLAPSTPMQFPSSGRWLMKILARRNRFVIGMYRRHMKVIGYLGTLDRLYGVAVTTRNWNTIAAIGRVLSSQSPE